MTIRNGERERDLYNFLAELSEELGESTDENGMHSTDSREAFSVLSEDLKKSLNCLINTRDAKIQVGNDEMEAIKASALHDIDRGVTLTHCIVELEKFLYEYPDLDMDVAQRIKNKLKENKNPEAI